MAVHSNPHTGRSLMETKVQLNDSSVPSQPLEAPKAFTYKSFTIKAGSENRTRIISLEG